MNKKTLLYVVLLTTGFLAYTPSKAVQSESPVACNEGGEPVTLVYGDHTTGCEVDSPTDTDLFVFDAVADEQVRIIVLSETGGFDPRLELRDPTGAVIHDEFCNGRNQFGQPTICSFRANITLPLTGTYLIAMSDQGSNESGSYSLQIERIPADPINTALDDDFSIDDSIAPPTDMDFYVLQATAGVDVRITVLSQTPDLDPRLEVWDPDGVLVEDQFCNGRNQFGQPTICSFIVDITPLVTGNYVVAISDTGSNESGDYQIQTQCLSPFDCLPPLARAGCNIEMDQAVYIDGETATASEFRIANLTAGSLALEWKVWLGIPGSPPIGVINLGADGSFVLPPGTDLDLGPLAILPVTPTLPRGEYEFSCRLLDPVTGRLLLEDRNFFELQ